MLGELTARAEPVLALLPPKMGRATFDGSAARGSPRGVQPDTARIIARVFDIAGYPLQDRNSTSGLRSASTGAC